MDPIEIRIDGRLRLADQHPRGGPDGWVGSLLPADLTPDDSTPDGAPADPAPPGSLTARRAAVFGRAQPVLFATAPGRAMSRGPVAGDGVRPAAARAEDANDIVAGCSDPAESPTGRSGG